MKNLKLKNILISSVIGLGTAIGLGSLFATTAHAEDSPATGQTIIPINDNMTGASSATSSSDARPITGQTTIPSNDGTAGINSSTGQMARPTTDGTITGTDSSKGSKPKPL